MPGIGAIKRQKLHRMGYYDKLTNITIMGIFAGEWDH